MRTSNVLAALAASVALACVTISPIFSASATCGLAAPAFCDDLSGGASPGGRAGDLNDALWSVSRNVQGGNSSSDLMSFPQVPAAACKAGVTQANPDNDVMVCDAASGHQGQVETAMIAQNYAMLSLRPRQAFDFAGRTGVIAYNVDAITQGEGAWWTSVYVTDAPTTGVINSSEVMGLLPNNGLGLDFNDQCGVQNTSLTRVNTVELYANTVESEVPLSGTSCFATSRGHLNHIEIHLSSSAITLWASDASPDGITFPNFRQVGAASISLPFTRGYVHFQQNERAPLKNESGFYSPGYAQNYWSNLGFDGPVVGQETGYAAPDSLTVNPNVVPDVGESGALNVGYAAPSTLSIANVNPAGVTAATLTFSMTYTYAFNLAPNTVKLHYSLNGGPAQTPPQPNYAAELRCNGCPGAPNGGGGVPYVVSINPAALVAGTNTVAITVDNQNNGYPPVIANMDLLTFGGGAVPTATPTPVVVPTGTAIPTTIPTATATPIPTATTTAQTCTLVLSLNGTPTTYTRPLTDCANQ